LLGKNSRLWFLMVRKETMRKLVMLFSAGFLSLALVCCGPSEAAKENVEKAQEQQPKEAEEQIAIGGFEVEGLEGREIEVPEATVDREYIEEYLEEVRPIVENTTQDLSRVVSPSARLGNRALILTIEVESIEQARQEAREGRRQLRQLEPPENLEPVHERLIDTYEDALPAYENIIEAFNGEDVGTLTETVQESLPEIEQAIVEERSILQELQRAATQEAQRAE
jgi:malonyl CoA-acyl carrier protein transacylase